ncbi:hypothetical protein [Mucilaginibacter dorajii]|jgi:hypothetical protein|uniref:Uncharacterized protein n=1 Tax=Mucilaginibacter dorajii TaxID=692994 RepID=A0ABP7QY21_9SPHI|nr:hypothetical protein [Mucilaginibacter dorajii]MCS3732507.1 hypothetical protein [Mucilaginibacter dorajii]
MKKLLSVMLGITCIVAFSFFKNAQKLGFTKLSTSLYTAHTIVPMSDANKSKLKEVFAKEYGIKNFNQQTTVTYKKVTDSKYPKLTGYSVADKTVGAEVFTETTVNKPVGEDQEVTQRGIYASSASVASVAAMTSVLEAYKN